MPTGDDFQSQVGFSLLWAFVCHSDANNQAIAMTNIKCGRKFAIENGDILGYAGGYPTMNTLDLLRNQGQ